MKQPQYQPYPVEDQVVLLWAATNGLMDTVAVSRIADFKADLQQYLRTNHPQIGQSIRQNGVLNDELVERLRTAISEFLQTGNYGE